jgi:hypothetical protein
MIPRVRSRDENQDHKCEEELKAQSQLLLKRKQAWDILSSPQRNPLPTIGLSEKPFLCFWVSGSTTATTNQLSPEIFSIFFPTKR